LLPVDEAWSAARAFTEKRLEQIRLLKYELSLQRLCLANYDSTPIDQRNPHDHDDDRNAVARTIARLDSILADLQRGMTAPAPGE